MRYVRITDTDDGFPLLREKLLTEHYTDRRLAKGEKTVVCRYNTETEDRLLKLLSDYIWDVKFLSYVIEHVKATGEAAIRVIDTIIDTMNVANTFKEEDDVLASRLKQYFTENKEINLSGFVHFRLRDFLSDFDKLLDFYNNSYQVETEYMDFVRTLKDYLARQPESCSEVHVVCPGGVPYILDANGNDITEESIAALPNQAEAGEATRDDMIVSSLISMAPRVLHLHKSKHVAPPMLYETLKAIFACRVIVE